MELGRKSSSRRDMNSVCHTDYDNAESEDFFSDSELMGVYIDKQQNSNVEKNLNNMNNSNRLAHKLKQAFSGVDITYNEANNFLPKQNKKLAQNQNQLPPVAPNSGMRRLQRNGLATSNGKGLAYEGDIDSNCSSVASSLMFLNAKNKVLTPVERVDLTNRTKWKSVHSIGYDNEYEFASEVDYYDSSDYDVSDADIEAEKLTKLNTSKINSDSCELLGAFDPLKLKANNSVFNDSLKFLAMDEDTEDEHIGLENNSLNNENKKVIIKEEILDARCQVHALSRDIRQNFGDYKLASFSDIDA